MSDVITIKSISEAHQAMGVPPPSHPLVSVVWEKDLRPLLPASGSKIRIDLYQIWSKQGRECELGYGRNAYDFREGTLAFFKAGQVLTATEFQQKKDADGWVLLFHPDLIRKSELGRHIHEYSFFDYEVFEALHVSESERASLTEIAAKIDHETGLNIDRHSQHIIVSNIELLLGYCTRYYDRQFYTRTNFNQDLVSRFEQLLRNYYTEGKQLSLGIPTVKYCAEEMNMSAHYLSDLLKKETGKNTQEHIHHFVIDQAKTLLLGTTEAVGQIAYGLGFEYPQHFAKLFKAKTGMSPLEYKQLN